MTDLTKLTNEELLTELMVACHGGVCALPANAAKCRVELLHRLTHKPTGDDDEFIYTRTEPLEVVGRTEITEFKPRKPHVICRDEPAPTGDVPDNFESCMAMIGGLGLGEGCYVEDLEEFKVVRAAVTALQAELADRDKDRSYWIRRVIELGQLFGYDGDQCADVAGECIESGAVELAEAQEDRELFEFLLNHLPIEIREHVHPSTKKVTSYVLNLWTNLPLIFQEDTPRAAIRAAIAAQRGEGDGDDE